MSANEDLKRIKKLYGENMMKLCRVLFPTLLEHEGLLLELLTSSFAVNSRDLYNDIVDNNLEDEFRSVIYSKYDAEKNRVKIFGNQTPYELLAEAGYKLFECTTEDEIQSFKKYYAKGEELCTFKGKRLERCIVFWAIKNGAEKLNRKDFENPEREDEYGTSVISIQFSNGKHSIVSIKNRYNHTVNNPDATFGNDLDRIVPGLTASFSKLLADRDIELDTRNREESNFPNYTVANDGKYYKYNMEIGGIYYCPGNVIIDNGNVIKLEPEKKELFDCFVLDKEKKALKLYDKNLTDSFVYEFDNIEKIEEKVDKQTKERTFFITNKGDKFPAEIKVDSNNNLIGYKNPNIKDVLPYFLKYNSKLRELDLPNLTLATNYFLCNNRELTELNLPSLTKAGDDFVRDNRIINKINLPNLQSVGDRFLWESRMLEELSLPSLTTVGRDFVRDNQNIHTLNLPKLVEAEDFFLADNRALLKLSLPNLQTVGNGFLCDNDSLQTLEAPKLREIGDRFLWENCFMSELDLPNLAKIGNDFLRENYCLEKLNLPKVRIIGDRFLWNNVSLSKLVLPSLEVVGYGFLNNDQAIKELEVPNLLSAGEDFLNELQKLNTLVINKNAKLDKRSISSLCKNAKLTSSELKKGKEVVEALRRNQREIRRDKWE